MVEFIVDKAAVDVANWVALSCCARLFWIEINLGQRNLVLYLFHPRLRAKSVQLFALLASTNFRPRGIEATFLVGARSIPSDVALAACADIEARRHYRSWIEICNGSRRLLH